MHINYKSSQVHLLIPGLIVFILMSPFVYLPTFIKVEDYFMISLMVVAAASTIFNGQVITYHMLYPPHPKFLMSKARKILGSCYLWNLRDLYLCCWFYTLVSISWNRISLGISTSGCCIPAHCNCYLSDSNRIRFKRNNVVGLLFG